MRELVFELDYDPGWNPVADTLAEHEAATIRSLSCHVTEQTLWRVDLVNGPAPAREAVEAAYRSAEYFPDCLVTGECEADSDTRILDRTDDALVIYCEWAKSPVCSSVPHLALAHLGEGLLLETLQDGRQHVWRIVHSGDGSIGPFAEALQEEIEDVGGMELLRLTEHEPGSDTPHQETDGLPPEQRRALAAAVNRGYYETPRAIELTDLAAALEVPQSTLSYRLQRAEAHLARQFVDADRTLESVSPSSE